MYKRFNNKRRRIKYTVNDDFFKKWSQDMAYILGFWFADGSIYKNYDKKWDCYGYMCNISQSIRDIWILEKIKEKIQYDGKIYEHKKGKFDSVCSLSICSKYFYDDLIKLGGMEKKSLIVDFPKIPKKYLASFLRGFFDGDGYIGIDEKNNYLRMAFTGGEKFLLEIKDIFKEKFNYDMSLSKGTYSKEKNIYCYRLKYCSKKADKILEWMYGEVEKNKSDLYLQRKYDIYKSWRLLG